MIIILQIYDTNPYHLFSMQKTKAKTKNNNNSNATNKMACPNFVFLALLITCHFVRLSLSVCCLSFCPVSPSHVDFVPCQFELPIFTTSAIDLFHFQGNDCYLVLNGNGQTTAVSESY